MTESEKSRGFGWLRDQAKTLSDLFWENEIDFQIWLKLKGSVTEPVDLAPKFAEKWVPLSSVEEKACALRKLLENRPKASTTNYLTEKYDSQEVTKWFERFVGEFEAVFGKEGSGGASEP